MPLSEPTPNLATALAAFQKEMPRVAKGKTATVPTKAGGSYSYTYADLADVSEAAMPLLTKHGLAFSVTPQRFDGVWVLEGRLLHSSGEQLVGALPLDGRSAQEYGSSITYGRRYLLGCLTGIVTDDDDDGSIATEAHARRTEAASVYTASQARMLALMKELGLPDPASMLAYAKDVVGRDLAGAKDLSQDEVTKVIEALAAEIDMQKQGAKS